MEIVKCMGCMEEYHGYPCPYCGYDPRNQQKTSFLLSPETILGGKYLIGKMLGQGGFGITYIGWDIALERKVAIKEYYPSGQVSRMPGTRSLVWSESEQARTARLDGMQMFLKEARKMARLDEIPGVVKIRDLFQENDTAYIVMDFVEGQTLKEALKRGGPMSWDRAQPLFLSAIRAMEKVHASGLIHRDLSPDNLMLTPDGQVKILDLGAAKDLSINSGASSMQVAKGGFSPFEQYSQRGGSGPWTDVYAMAATIYYTLTGKVPPTAIDRVTEDTISWDLPGLMRLPAPALQALKKAMAVLPKQRTQSMAELERGLLSLGNPDPIPRPTPKPAPIPTPKPAPAPTPSPTPTPKPKSQTKVWILAAAVLLLAVLPWAFRNSGKSSPSEPTTASSTMQKDITSDDNWEQTLDRMIAAGTQDVYNYQNGAKLEMYFDGDNEVARVFTNEEGTVEYTFKARYDANGELLEERGYDSEGIQRTRTVYTRDADGNVLEKLTYGETGALDSRRVYSLDSDGNVLETTIYDWTGSVEHVITFSYDSEGREIQMEYKDGDSNCLSRSTTTYASDGSGRESFEDDDGTTQIQRYDPEGNLLEYIRYDASGKQEYRGVNRYDDKSHKIEWCSYDADDKLSYREVYIYRGDLKISGTSYSYSNDGTERVTERKYLYASHDVEVGNITLDGSSVDENFMSIQGTTLRSFSRYTSGSYKSSSVTHYDWNGNYQLYLGYDENGELNSKSVCHYDADGNQTGRTFYYYSSYFDKTTVTEYDADNNEISKKEYPGRSKLLES